MQGVAGGGGVLPGWIPGRRLLYQGVYIQNVKNISYAALLSIKV